MSDFWVIFDYVNPPLEKNYNLKILLTDKPNYPAPTEDCTYQVFDLISDAFVENAIAKYSSKDKILELSNVEKDRGYALKIGGEEMGKFVMNTAHFDEKYDRHIIVGKAIETGIILLIVNTKY